jgi:phosphatidylglycerophosphatase A
MSDPTPNPPSTTTNSAALPGSSKPRKPRISIAIATAFGLGYLPKAPGTWGSLGGVALIMFYWSRLVPYKSLDIYIYDHYFILPFLGITFTVAVFVSGIGLFAANRAASYLGQKDPQIVVVDEVSGQLISYLGIGAAVPNWKYLLLGFILFRVFDIWKPFPARQAESLPGGLGIMADDWIAGIYAALGLWIARAFGL